MSSFEHKPSEFLRACVACGGLPLKARRGPLCGFCEKFFLKNVGLISRLHTHWSAHSLWRWEDDESVVGEVVRRLKGGGDENVYDYFAQIFLQQWFMAKGRISQKTLVIPAPAREGAKKDHAFCFARSIAKMLAGAELHTPLLRPTKDEQKMRNEIERHQQRFVTREPFAANERMVIFVDDVIVTGGTIEAAYAALGEPKNFVAWCLADRIRLC